MQPQTGPRCGLWAPPQRATAVLHTLVRLSKHRSGHRSEIADRVRLIHIHNSSGPSHIHRRCRRRSCCSIALAASAASRAPAASAAGEERVEGPGSSILKRLKGNGKPQKGAVLATQEDG
jgi:hypothetical protein